MAEKKQAPKSPVVGEPSKADPIEDVQKGFENWCKANPDSDYCYVRPEDRKKSGGRVKYKAGGKVRGNGCCARPKKCKMR